MVSGRLLLPFKRLLPATKRQFPTKNALPLNFTLTTGLHSYLASCLTHDKRKNCRLVQLLHRPLLYQHRLVSMLASRFHLGSPLRTFAASEGKAREEQNAHDIQGTGGLGR